jgi:hypothetical protein
MNGAPSVGEHGRLSSGPVPLTRSDRGERGHKFVRIIVRHGCRGEIHELPSRDLLLGSGEDADLVIDHPSVAESHAKLLVRRGRVLLVDLGAKGKLTRVGNERPRAPAVLSGDGTFWLGAVELAASLVSRSLPLSSLEPRGFSIEHEVEGSDLALRRFLVRKEELTAELAILDEDCPSDLGRAWAAHVLESAELSAPHLPRVVDRGEIGGRTFIVEAIPAGVRLELIIDAVARRRLVLPIEARVAITAQVAEAIASVHAVMGPHGSLEPRSIHVGVDGALVLLRPGPLSDRFDARRRAFLAPERRCGTAASAAADAWSLFEIARRLTPKNEPAKWPEGIAPILGSLAAQRAEARRSDLLHVGEEIRALAHEGGLDPGAGHLARVARLLGPSLTPIARTGRAGRENAGAISGSIR